MSQGPPMGTTTAQPVSSGPAVQFRKKSEEGTSEDDREGGPSGPVFSSRLSLCRPQVQTLPQMPQPAEVLTAERPHSPSRDKVLPLILLVILAGYSCV